ncbi:unnamed protein product [Mytilus edulis]|uniref:Integrase zinc-binding domain-containing protein n=1 Tax=Mytilus edulis TaxID=6550 RepID=A0A8S3R316_MYTED|nr:unnamed protein product [Mytilus edulis]
MEEKDRPKTAFASRQGLSISTVAIRSCLYTSNLRKTNGESIGGTAVEYMSKISGRYNCDLSRPFIQDTDASNNAIQAVLSQEIDDKERVIAFCGYSSDLKAQQLVQTVSSKPDECERDTDGDTEISLKHLQDNDKNLQIVRQWVQDGHTPNLKTLGEYNYVIKGLWSQFDDLKIQDGVLCKVHRVIVPLTERRRILKQCHDNKTSGHLGIKKTLSRIKDRIYWLGVRQDTVAYIAVCEVCAKRKGPNKRQRAPMQLQKSGYPMEHIATVYWENNPKPTEDKIVS